MAFLLNGVREGDFMRCGEKRVAVCRIKIHLLRAIWMALSIATLGGCSPLNVVALKDAEIHKLKNEGRYAEALPKAREVLALEERILGPNHRNVAISLLNLADLLRLTGDYAEAKLLYERSLRIFEGAHGPNHSAVADVSSGLADTLTHIGDYVSARQLFERALRVKEQALGPNDQSVAVTLDNLAGLLQTTGDYAAAQPLRERALKIFEQSLGPNHSNVAAALNNLAELLRIRGDYAGARPLFERAVRIFERVLGSNHPYLGLSLNDFADLLQATGKYADAKLLYERALKILEKTLSPNHPWVARSLNNLADLLWAVGDYSQAKPLYERAIRIARTAGEPESRWRGSLGLGRVREREAQLGEALLLYEEAVRTLEELAGQFGHEAHRAEYLKAANRLAAYDALARLLLKLHQQDPSKGYDSDAWAVIEAKKGRMIAETLATARPKLQDPQARLEANEVQAKQDQALALEKALREQQMKPPNEQRAESLQNLTTLLAKTKAEYLGQVQTFLARYPQYKSQFVDQQTVDPKALAKFAERLPAGTLAVQYFAAPDRLYLFVVAPGKRFQVKSRAVSQADLYGMIRQYRQYIERATSRRLPWADDGSAVYRRDVVPLKEVSRKLAAHLLEPIEAELKMYRNLILIPNDLLLYLPIHALTRDQPAGSTRFLAETHTVSYLTLLELADLLSSGRRDSNIALLALANPDGSLPGASEEVRAIAKTRPVVRMLEGPQATKARFLSLAAQFPYIHLATHGVLNPDRPERSYLLMAGSEGESQRLSIGDIAGLSLRGGLAILSACETAVGEQVPGAALITLAAAFSQAGSQSILASLWKVEDEATRELMVTFHRALHKIGRATALQEAQMVVLKKPSTAHPFYWAAFILIGAR